MTYYDTIEQAQEEILAHLRESFNQDVYEVAIPPEGELVRDRQGKLKPYIAIQFGDLQQVGARNMASSLHNNYVLPFYIGAVASDAKIIRRLNTRLNVNLLGLTVSNGGQVEKRAGGMIFYLPAQMGAVEAYISPASFSVPVDVRAL